MSYKILLANGDQLFERKVDCINSILIEDEVYILRDATGVIVFTSPVNSVVCIQQD